MPQSSPKSKARPASSPKRKPAPRPKRGASRTFIALAVIMAILMVGGLLAVVVLAGNQRTEQSGINASVTAIISTNAAIEMQLAATQSQARVAPEATP